MSLSPTVSALISVAASLVSLAGMIVVLRRLRPVAVKVDTIWTFLLRRATLEGNDGEKQPGKAGGR